MKGKPTRIGITLTFWFLVHSVCLGQAPDKKFLVQFRVDEKCYECPWRFSQTCTQNQSDCNVPFKSTDYYEWFSTQEDALDFINNKFKHLTPPCRPEQPCQERPSLPPRARRPEAPWGPFLIGIYEIGREVPVGVKSVRKVGAQEFFLAPERVKK